MPDVDDERRRGREAPMVITPGALLRLARQLAGAGGRLARAAARRRGERRRGL